MEPSVGNKIRLKKEANGYLWAQDSWALENPVYLSYLCLRGYQSNYSYIGQ